MHNPQYASLGLTEKGILSANHAWEHAAEGLVYGRGSAAGKPDAMSFEDAVNATDLMAINNIPESSEGQPVKRVSIPYTSLPEASQWLRNIFPRNPRFTLDVNAFKD